MSAYYSVVCTLEKNSKEVVMKLEFHQKCTAIGCGCPGHSEEERDEQVTR